MTERKFRCLACKMAGLILVALMGQQLMMPKQVSMQEALDVAVSEVTQ